MRRRLGVPDWERAGPALAAQTDALLGLLDALDAKATFFILGAVAFTAATIGYQHRRRHQPGDTGHIAGMGIAYVAMLTAFYVDNGPHLPLWDRLPAFAFWLLPSAIGAPVIIRAILGARHAPGPPRTRQDTTDSQSQR